MLQASVFIYAKDEEIHLLLHMHAKYRKKYVEENRGEKEEKCTWRDKEKSEVS